MVGKAQVKQGAERSDNSLPALILVSEWLIFGCTLEELGGLACRKGSLEKSPYLGRILLLKARNC